MAASALPGRRPPASSGFASPADEMSSTNIFERLMHLPGYRKDLRSVSVAVFSAGASARSDSFYVLATWGSGSQTEGLLDDACTLAEKRPGLAGNP